MSSDASHTTVPTVSVDGRSSGRSVAWSGAAACTALVLAQRAHALTSSVPTMPRLLWYLQKNWILPAWSGVNETLTVLPFSRSLSTLADDTLKLCSALPSFLNVSVTFSPAFAVRVL